MDSGGISIEKYAEYVQNTVNELKNISTDRFHAVIASIFAYEKANSLLSRRELEPLNKELYLALKEKVINPMLLSERISAESVLLAALIAKSSFRVPKSPSDRPVIQKLTEKFSSIKDENYHSVKTHYAVFLFVAETFKGDGSDTRSAFLERLVDLNVNTFQQNEADFRNFMGLLTQILDREKALKILKNGVFKGKFWNKDLNVKKSNLLWVVPSLWNTYGFEKEFKELYPIWLDIFRKAIQKNMTELVFFMHFHLSHIYLNLAHTQQEFKQFNDDVEKPLSEYIKTKVIPEYSITPCGREKTGKPRRVGFVYDRLINNSPTKLLYSWLERLTKENPDTEYYVYDIEYVEKSRSEQHFINLITSLGVRYFSAHKAIKDADKYSYYSHFDKTLILRDKIMQDGIDELIMCNNREQFSLLFTARTAPVQTYWCHGNFEYDIEGIDKRITHINGMQENNLPFERFALVQSDVFFAEEQQRAKTAASVIRKRFPEGSIILGSIGRLIKIEGDQYLETVAEIMKQYPDTVYLACGTGGRDNIFKKAKELGISSRFFFEGHIDPQVYAHVIDIYLNTFPNPSGESANEYLKLNNGAGVVSLSGSLPSYIQNARELIELHKEYGREAVRDMYLYDGKSRKINENSPALKGIKEKAEEIRGSYPAGTVFIGIIGDTGLADTALKEFLTTLKNVVFIYSDEKLELFAEQNSLKVRFRLTANFAGNIKLQMPAYAASPHISLLKLMQQCCVPALLTDVRSRLEKLSLIFEKADEYTDELCLTLILAGMYGKLELMGSLYTDKPSKNMRRLFLYNYFNKNILPQQEALPKAFMTEQNITCKSLRPLFALLFKYTERPLIDKDEQKAVKVLTSMLLSEYEAENLDNTGKDFLLRTLAHGGRPNEIESILTREISRHNLSQELYILYSALFILYGDIEEAVSLAQKAEIDPQKEYPPVELLQISFIKAFCGDFESAYIFLGKLYEKDKSFFSETPTPSLLVLLALIYKALNCGCSEVIWNNQARKDIFYENKKHLWDKIPVSHKSFTAYPFDGIDDI